MRPNVVAFGEEIDGNALWAARRALAAADALIAVGISAQTTAPGLLAREARRDGVPTFVVTLEPSPSLTHVFDRVVDAPADRLDEWLADVGSTAFEADLAMTAEELSDRLTQILG